MPPIAVLPFQSMSADGIVEDIITGLSRILRLFEPRWRTRCRAGLPEG
jgi:TolB-like protein